MPNQTTATKAATRTTGVQLFGTPSLVGMPVVGMPVGDRVGCRSLLHMKVVQHSISQEVAVNCCSRYSLTLLQAFVLSRRNGRYENIVPK